MTSFVPTMNIVRSILVVVVPAFEFIWQYDERHTCGRRLLYLLRDRLPGPIFASEFEVASRDANGTLASILVLVPFSARLFVSTADHKQGPDTHGACAA